MSTSTRPVGKSRAPATRELSPPLRLVAETLHGDAQRHSGEILAAAEARGHARLDEARAEAARTLDEARAEAEATADRAAAVLMADAHRQALALVLGARREVYEEVRRRALAALRDRAGTGEAEALASRLAETARARLGDDAAVHPPADGGIGIVAERRGRRVDLSTKVLVDLHMSSLGEVLRAVWE